MQRSCRLASFSTEFLEIEADVIYGIRAAADLQAQDGESKDILLVKQHTPKILFGS